MKQTLTRALSGLDPTTRRAAQAAADSVGLPLEDWLEQAVAEQAERSELRSGSASIATLSDPRADELEEIAGKLKRMAEERASNERRGFDHVLAASAASERRVRETVEKTATALDSVAAWIERAEDRFGETSRAASDSQERTAALVSETIGMVTRRLDDIERKLESGEHASVADAIKAIQRMELRLSAASPADQAEHGAQIEAALRGFEDRIAGLTERLSGAAPRPLGRRGIPAGAELRSAISEIRTRQFELDHGPGPREDAAGSQTGDLLRSLRDDIARLSGRLDAERPADGEVAALRAEISDLQGAVRALARRDDVVALEDSIRALQADVSDARSAGEGPGAMIAPLRSLETEVRRLAEQVAPDANGQLASHIERLADKLDLVAGAGVDPSALDGLSDQLSDVRAMLAAVPGPDQVETLARQVAALVRETSELKTRQIDAGDFASVKQAVEDIRTALSSPPRSARGAARLDDLKNTVAPIQSELERLSRHVEGFVESGSPSLFDGLVAKLDRIEENIRRSGAGQDLRESLLHQLADKLDKAGRPGAGPDALEALERQIEAIASRLDRGFSGDPAIASLERVLHDLTSQVGTLRDGTLEAAELAARNAVAGTLSALPQKVGGANGDIGALKRDMTDIKAYQGLADKRTQSSLDTLQTTLDKLLARLETGDEQSPPTLSAASRPTPVKPPSIRIEPAARTAAKAAALDAATSTTDRAAPAFGPEILLEPGAGRPGAEPAPTSPAAEPAEDAADIRASFIAKARRAAQAAANEAAADIRERSVPRAADTIAIPASEISAAGASAFRATLAKRSRPILIGVAAVVLALLTFQVYRSTERGAGSSIAIHDGTRTAPSPVAGPPPVEPRDPRTTDSIVPASPTQSVAPSPPMLAEARPPAANVFTPPTLQEPTTTAAVPTTETLKPPAPAELAAKPETKAAPEAGQSAALGTPIPAMPARPDRPVPTITSSDLPATITPAGLRQAALTGDSAALYELALRASEGRGLNKDAKLAARLFEKAASQGLAPAQYRTGSLYEKGVGVARDLEAARYWYQRSAELGNTRAMHNLAVLLAEGGNGRPDYAAALEWFKRAADYGVRDSQFNLGVLLARGLGTQQDLSRAYTWFAIAAMQGDEDAGRKRDEVGSRMAASDVTAAKQAAERWRARTANQTANEAPAPAVGWSETPQKKPVRDGRV